MDLAQVHAGVAVPQADALAVLLEAVGAVVVDYHSPHIVIGIAGDSTVCANRDVSTHIVVASLFAGQRLFIGGGVDHYLVAIGDGGHTLRLHGVFQRLHRAGHTVQHRHGFQGAVLRDGGLVILAVQLAVHIFTVRRVAAIQSVVDFRTSSSAGQGDLRAGGHGARLGGGLGSSDGAGSGNRTLLKTIESYRLLLVISDRLVVAEPHLVASCVKAHMRARRKFNINLIFFDCKCNRISRSSTLILRSC